MDKIFGLSIFCNFFVVGIFLGRSRKPLSSKLVGAAFVYFMICYICMGLILSVNTDFLKPH